MANIFLASDHHFGHSNILTFNDNDGKKIRVFDHVDAMNEHMIERHNSVVRPEDKVYFIGDVTFSNRNLHLVGRMNGEKVLIKGNHDTLKVSQYVGYFKDIRGSHSIAGLIMTHIPIHPDSLARWGFNVHGHLHANRVMGAHGKEDPRYFNVAMEQINYTPIALEEVRAIRAARGVLLPERHRGDPG